MRLFVSFRRNVPPYDRPNRDDRALTMFVHEHNVTAFYAAEVRAAVRPCVHARGHPSACRVPHIPRKLMHACVHACRACECLHACACVGPRLACLPSLVGTCGGNDLALIWRQQQHQRPSAYPAWQLQASFSWPRMRLTCQAGARAQAQGSTLHPHLTRLTRPAHSCGARRSKEWLSLSVAAPPPPPPAPQVTTLLAVLSKNSGVFVHKECGVAFQMVDAMDMGYGLAGVCRQSEPRGEASCGDGLDNDW